MYLCDVFGCMLTFLFRTFSNAVLFFRKLKSAPQHLVSCVCRHQLYHCNSETLTCRLISDRLLRVPGGSAFCFVVWPERHVRIHTTLGNTVSGWKTSVQTFGCCCCCSNYVISQHFSSQTAVWHSGQDLNISESVKLWNMLRIVSWIGPVVQDTSQWTLVLLDAFCDGRK